MRKLIYKKFLGTDDTNQIIEIFHNTIIETNRTLDFFVDWKKVEEHVENYKLELNILNSLIGSKNFDEELENILRKYPEVIHVIPLLIAIRDKKFQVIEDFSEKEIKVSNYNFSKKDIDDSDIKKMLELFKKTGLKNFILNLANRSLIDYLYGVEVGLDTHSRKNRSGSVMELLIKQLVEDINKKHGNLYSILYQKNFKHLEQLFGIQVVDSLRSRKADFILVSRDYKNIFNIEVNFYSGSGSKPQEIVESYIQRQYELKKNNINFIWITDGIGWEKQKNQIHRGFQEIDYVLNLHFVRTGILEEILCQI